MDIYIGANLTNVDRLLNVKCVAGVKVNKNGDAKDRREKWNHLLSLAHVWQPDSGMALNPRSRSAIMGQRRKAESVGGLSVSGEHICRKRQYPEQFLWLLTCSYLR